MGRRLSRLGERREGWGSGRILRLRWSMAYNGVPGPRTQESQTPSQNTSSDPIQEVIAHPDPTKTTGKYDRAGAHERNVEMMATLQPAVIASTLMNAPTLWPR